MTENTNAHPTDEMSAEAAIQLVEGVAGKWMDGGLSPVPLAQAMIVAVIDIHAANFGSDRTAELFRKLADEIDTGELPAHFSGQHPERPN